MSLFSRLYPERSVHDVLRSSAGMLAAQSVQQAISEIFPVFWSSHSMVEPKGKSMSFTKGPFTLRFICGSARMKLSPVSILSVLGLPIYMVQAQIKCVRVPFS